MSDPDDSDLAVQQRRVDAASVPAPPTSAASSVFNWRGPGTAAEPSTPPAPAPAPVTTTGEEEETMARKTTTAGAKRRKPIPLILQLLQAGDQPRKAIGEQLQLSASVLHNNLARMKTDGLVTMVDGNYHLTRRGAGELANTAGEPAAAPDKPERKRRGAHARKKATATRRRTAKPPKEELDTSPNGEVASDFRCAVMSDGAFFITKLGVVIELDADEHRQMLAYLERMAEPEAA